MAVKGVGMSALKMPFQWKKMDVGIDIHPWTMTNASDAVCVLKSVLN